MSGPAGDPAEQADKHPPLSDRALARRLTRILKAFFANPGDDPGGPVLILPPDLTRIHSRAGLLTGAAYRFFSDVTIMPALGTHRPLSPEEIARMFPDCPAEIFLPHRWREDTVELGRLEADWVEAAFCGQAALRRMAPVQVSGPALNKKEAEAAYRRIQKRQNRYTQKTAIFVNNSFNKIRHHRGFDMRVIPVLGQAFECAVHMYDEPVDAAHKVHANFTGYSHYAVKIVIDGREAYARFTIENLKTKKTGRGSGNGEQSQFHSVHLSYEKNNAASPRVHSSIINLATWGTGGTTDLKLQQWLNAVKPPESRDSAFHMDWPVEVNRLLLKNPPSGRSGDSPSGQPGGGKPFSLIVSIGQVVPHEIAGMANHAKNIFVGSGGAGAIHKSHWLGALYGLERLMGTAENPVRALFDEALRRYGDLLPPILWVLTVVDHHHRVRGLFCGFGRKCFEDAAALAAELNIQRISEAGGPVPGNPGPGGSHNLANSGGIRKIVVWLDPEEYRSTWLGNKAIYRTRRAMAEGGELVILAPGLDRFGEDPALDALIRRYGYRGTEAIRRAVETGGPLAENLSAAAHLIHGSGEGRFTIRYCTPSSGGGGEPSGTGPARTAIEAAGYAWGDLEATRARYMPEGPDGQSQGWNCTADGERYYFIRNPALGLWVHEKIVR